MAGAGYKLFVSGDVLTAAQVNNYLQEQAVMVFASSAARTTALSGVLAEGMITYLSDINEVQVYNGTTWVSPAAPSGNYVVNGGMDVWQRGTSSFTGDNVYTADRWYLYRGTTGKTVTQQTSSLPDGFTYSLRCQRDNGNTSTSIIRISQSMENQQTVNLIGKTVVLSFWAKCGANYSPTSSSLAVQLLSGTGTNQNVIIGLTGQATVINQNATLTTSWQRFSYSATVSSSVTQLAIDFLMTPVGTASTNDWFEITGVQLELGSLTSTFRRSGGTIQGELAACQRYYYRRGGQQLYTTVAPSGYTTSTTNVRALVQSPVTMRTTPTAVEYSTLQWVDVDTVEKDVSAVGINTGVSGTDITALDFTISAGTSLRSGYLRTKNSTSGYLGVSAEL